ncbi:glycerophosphodiester phosphodiesterase family protein [Furfurilactobacillus entadae]|uniref:glycerophosphodiester phosphodiesterase family protein n=1 Tax=Furfurilactobacillus entadae TaxID=2922307 RepID=UPI0035EAF392
MTLIIAHRGLITQGVENTQSAFEAALALGVDGIETDVQQTADGVPVLIHDEAIDRITTGQGLVNTWQWTDLRRLPLRHEPAERLWSLSDALTWLTAHQFTGVLNIEVKTDHVRYPGLEAQVATLAQQAWPFTIVFSSFSSQSLQQLAALAPDIDRAQLFRWPTRVTTRLEATGVITSTHPKISWVRWAIRHQRLSNPAQRRGWTVNQPDDLRLCFQAGLGAVITDQPVLAQQLRQEVMNDDN